MLQFSLQPECANLLHDLKRTFGGSVYDRKDKSSVHYSSGGFEAARKIGTYFQTFGTCFRQRSPLNLCQAYELVAQAKHNTCDGMQKLQILRF